MLTTPAIHINLMRDAFVRYIYKKRNEIIKCKISIICLNKTTETLERVYYSANVKDLLKRYLTRNFTIIPSKHRRQLLTHIRNANYTSRNEHANITPLGLASVEGI